MVKNVSDEIAALIFAVEVSCTLMTEAVNAIESLLTIYETFIFMVPCITTLY